MLKIMIIGAASAIATETARLFARDGASFFLVDLDLERITAIGDDLKVRGAKHATTYALDMTKLDQHQACLDAAIEALEGLDAVLIAHGTLTDQKRAQEDVEYALKEVNINALSGIALLTLLANYFEEQRRGSIAVISSVAGDRGRPSNYVYGAAKATLSTFLQGLRARLAKSGVHVLTVKPGLVDTPMTANLKKNPLYSSPTKVGEDIYHAMKNGRDIQYTPWFWMGVMMIIRNIPERIFKRLNM
jgi:short-subunit dehydrogenase